MDREETKKILAVIDNVYPNWHPKDPALITNIWTTIFREYRYEDVGEALRRYMVSDRNGFAPVPGQLIDILCAQIDATDQNELSAWSMVRKAVSNSGYHSAEEFQKLPETVRRAVGSPENLKEWSQMDIEAVETVIQASFLRSYRAALARAQEKRRFSGFDPEALLEAGKTPEIAENVQTMVKLVLNENYEPPDMSDAFTRAIYEKIDSIREGTA